MSYGKKKKKNKKHSRNKVTSLQQLKKDVQALLDQNLDRGYSEKQLAKALNLNSADGKRLISKVLLTLKEEGKASKVSRDKFMSTLKPDTLTGTVDHVNPRTAFIIVPDREDDIMVKTEKLNGALHGDTVEVMITRMASNGRAEGVVTKVVKRSRDQFVGKVELSLHYAFVVADNKNIYQDFYIKKEDLKGAKHNDKVIVEVTRWPEKDYNPEAKVLEILGKAGDNEAEIHSIMAEFGLPLRFQEKVLEDAENIPGKITKKDVEQRKDFRSVTTFTIDPEDAKDFDDALSVKFLENGDCEVGVHIADVSHYVHPDTLLEKEAYDRATSVYLVDRTIPMLPERLSNELCSLRPNEDKLTFSAVFILDKEAQVKSQWFGRTLIHSDRRFSYEEAQAVIEAGVGDYAEELKHLNHLAKTLKEERFRLGAINFETVEVKFKLDENGKPLGIIPKIRKDAHKMIEEFMLLANKKVAEFIFGMGKGKQQKPFVYRTHDVPDPEKLGSFALFAKRFGHSFDPEGDHVSRSLNGLLSEIEGKPEQNVLETLAVRSMAKAKYTTKPDGHFGLAFKHYTHFTSPIRRYPDVMVHRLLQHYLDGGKPVNKEEYEQKCVHSSEREKRASDAERASIKYKQVEFMASAKDKVYDGIVSGVTEWGVFVEITETKCEGMVRLADLTDDFYEFDEKNYRVIGRNNKRMIQLGDAVQVEVKKTDIDRRTIDLSFVWEK